MLGVNPYIAFSGNCEEALNFYKDCLDGEILHISRYEGSPMAQPGIENKILHASLKIGNSILMFCDNMSEHPSTVGNNISLAAGTNDTGDAEAKFKKMTDGGKVTMPMQETFWAERFGMLTDKFGINWMFNCDKPQQESETAAA